VDLGVFKWTVEELQAFLVVEEPQLAPVPTPDPPAPTELEQVLAEIIELKKRASAVILAALNLSEIV